MALKVMSYNIRHANPPSKPKFIDLDAIVAVIKAQNPDVVALQEVDVHTNRSGGVDQAKVIAQKLGMHYFFGKALDYDGGDYGVAILSRFPLEGAVAVPLPSVAGTNAEPRVLAYATIQISPKKSLVFASTHLDEKGNPQNRLLQLEKIAQVKDGVKLPFIIAGDFNATPGSESIQRLDALFTRTCQDCAFTFPVLEPNRTLDFIGYSPAARFKVVSHQVIPETYASDHRPIVAELRFLP
ncbi:hypothetical protein GCM10027189_12100 [Rufibacter soli]